MPHLPLRNISVIPLSIAVHNSLALLSLIALMPLITFMSLVRLSYSTELLLRVQPRHALVADIQIRQRLSALRDGPAAARVCPGACAEALVRKALELKLVVCVPFEAGVGEFAATREHGDARDEVDHGFDEGAEEQDGGADHEDDANA